MPVNTSRRGGCIPVGACGRWPQRGVWPCANARAKGCVRSAQGAKAVVGAFKKCWAPVCIKPLQPPWRAGKCIPPLVAGATTFPSASGGTMGAGQWRQVIFIEAAVGKTIQPPLARGNAPLLPPAAASSPEGQILAALCFEMLMRTNAERREDFPLRGAQRTHFVGAKRRTKCSESFHL